MSTAGLLLVLIAAFCHASWNFLLKRINGGPELLWLLSVVSVVIILPAAVFVIVHDRPVLDGEAFWLIAGSSVLHIGYFLLLQRGYRAGDLSLVYPTARATGPFLATVFAVIVLGEKMNTQIATGGFAVIFGVLCLTGGFGRKARHVVTSLAYGVATGALIASYTVWDAYAVSAALVPPILLEFVSMAVRTVLLAPLAASRWEATGALWRNHRGAVVGIAVLSPLAYILVLYALTFTPVVYVAPVREVSVLLTVLLGTLVLGEGRLKPRLGWALLIVTGVALLSTG